EVPPHDVLAGALELAASYQYFPSGTIFLVVVDPGVGSARRGIAVDVGDYKFVAPDNGVLSLVLDGHPPKRVVELSERRYARSTSAGIRYRRWFPPTLTRDRASSARSLAAPTNSRSPPTAQAPPRCSIWAAARPCAS